MRPHCFLGVMRKPTRSRPFPGERQRPRRHACYSRSFRIPRWRERAEAPRRCLQESSWVRVSRLCQSRVSRPDWKKSRRDVPVWLARIRPPVSRWMRSAKFPVVKSPRPGSSGEPCRRMYIPCALWLGGVVLSPRAQSLHWRWRSLRKTGCRAEG